jgi:hypothetical protein
MAERHPVQESPAGVSLERRVQLLEINLARLWDQVWWMQLPAEQRAEYEQQGFGAPIDHFYEED